MPRGIPNPKPTTVEAAPSVAENPVSVTTVRMVRDESFPAPHTADVHPDEVDNWKRYDWAEA